MLTPLQSSVMRKARGIRGSCLHDNLQFGSYLYIFNLDCQFCIGNFVLEGVSPRLDIERSKVRIV